MSDCLTELLAVAAQICRGEIPEAESNDCLTAGAFDLLIVKAKGPEAFSMLQALCERYRDLGSSDLDRRAFFMVLTLLAHGSGTTQVPDGLVEILRENPDLSAELRCWYRVLG